MKLYLAAIIYIFYIICTPSKSNAQLSIVAFYNCENYYDTINQANVVDEDFLPNSEKKYTQSVYNIKTRHLANVIYKLGKLNNADGISIIGLVEIENKMVLANLINEPLLRKYHYKFIHFDSKDPRGVDVAMIYNPAHFVPYQYRTYTLSDATHFNTYATRDILYVKGRLENEWVHLLINHWPSRRGGESVSATKRIWASSICKRIMDSVQMEDPKARFMVMGDFNDNPTNKSLKMLKMTNPFAKLYKRGIGSIAYNDSWNLFDQVLLSHNWGDKISERSEEHNLNDYKPVVYNNVNMIEQNGKYRGYPKRTFNGNLFRGGYSDHFPVALIFTLKTARNTQ